MITWVRQLVCLWLGHRWEHVSPYHRKCRDCARIEFKNGAAEWVPWLPPR